MDQRRPTTTSTPDAWQVRAVFQPLVDLASGRAIGNEALMRGDGPRTGQSPLDLLDEARATGRLVELDLAAVTAAVAGASRQSGTGSVFINVEPATLGAGRAALVEALRPLVARTSVVVEITERALAVDPAGVLAGAEELRRAGCSIALDDVGAEKESLAFIPILRPEVVKLDLGLLRHASRPATVMIAGAIRAYAEATGAEVVAEGIETPEDRVKARVLGATLGQGWLWGRPTDEPGRVGAEPARPLHPQPVGQALTASPFEIVAQVRSVERAPKRLLLPLTRTLELTAEAAPVPPVLLSSFQHRRNLSPFSLSRYVELAQRLPFVAVLGEDVPCEPAPGVRGADLRPDDPLAREWTVSVLGAHESVALVAREHDGDARTDMDREFDFAVTHDRALVTAVHHAMIGRLTSAV
ncbi:Phytochrome-like protein cph2 [Actinotalea ferrariae CF5-4]|uniref:Phytochrome-like protein cph2 n=1 Tax=Actinotalea ferrariae CF5-4 TaxID=948458 RepID=A0A021VUZ3_9CELL|nr:Phytochrome-like protein cph2 [Actinotalea ferrariae CF5-4]